MIREFCEAPTQSLKKNHVNMEFGVKSFGHYKLLHNISEAFSTTWMFKKHGSYGQQQFTLTEKDGWHSPRALTLAH